MSADWTTIRTAYVHGSDSMRELAEKHGIKAAGLMRRAANEGWDEERKRHSATISKAASEVITVSQVDELARFNADDLKMARAIRAKAARMMADTLTPQDLRAIAGAVDAAQKVGRLALGASTENKDIRGAIDVTTDPVERLTSRLAGITAARDAKAITH